MLEEEDESRPCENLVVLNTIRETRREMCLGDQTTIITHSKLSDVNTDAECLGCFFACLPISLSIPLPDYVGTYCTCITTCCRGNFVH